MISLESLIRCSVAASYFLRKSIMSLMFCSLSWLFIWVRLFIEVPIISLVSLILALMADSLLLLTLEKPVESLPVRNMLARSTSFYFSSWIS